MENPDSRKFRRKRCLNCNQLFSAEGKSVQQLGKWRKQKFCSVRCRSNYHALLAGSGKQIRAAVIRLVTIEIERLFPELVSRVAKDIKFLPPAGTQKSA